MSKIVRTGVACGAAVLMASVWAPGGIGQASPWPAVLEAMPQSLVVGAYTEAQAERGAAAYKRFCAGCHGMDLHGTDFGPGLSGAEMRARWKHRTVGDLYALTRSTMPVNSPGGLSTQRYADLIAFLLREADFPVGEAELPPDRDQLDRMAFEPADPEPH